MDLLKDKKRKANKEVRFCKKCGRKLPKDYKHKTCEACRTTSANVAKTVGITVTTAVLGTASIIGGIIIKNKK